MMVLRRGSVPVEAYLESSLLPPTSILSPVPCGSHATPAEVRFP